MAERTAPGRKNSGEKPPVQCSPYRTGTREHLPDHLLDLNTDPGLIQVHPEKLRIGKDRPKLVREPLWLTEHKTAQLLTQNRQHRIRRQLVPSRSTYALIFSPKRMAVICEISTAIRCEVSPR